MTLESNTFRLLANKTNIVTDLSSNYQEKQSKMLKQPSIEDNEFEKENYYQCKFPYTPQLKKKSIKKQNQLQKKNNKNKLLNDEKNLKNIQRKLNFDDETQNSNGFQQEFMALQNSLIRCLKTDE